MIQYYIEYSAISKNSETKWNSSTYNGKVPQLMEQRLKNVEQLPKKWKWNRCWKRVTVPKIAEHFRNSWNSSSKSETGTINSDERHN